jgi:hypothetical protein
MICPAIYNPASCESCAVIHLQAKNMSAAEIHCKICVVYGQNVISKGTAKQWCGMFKDVRTNVHDEEQSNWPTVVSEYHIQNVD